MPFGDLLRRLQGERALIDFRRDKMNADDVRGFVAGISDELVLIEVVGDDIRTDGHRIIERDDLTMLRWGMGRMRAWERAVELRDPAGPSASDLDLSDWRSAVASLQGTGGLATFHRERMDASTVYLAREFELTFDLIVGLQVTVEGVEDGSFAMRVEDLTRVDFGGGYERGLSRILATR